MICENCKKETKVGFYIIVDIYDVIDDIADDVFSLRNDVYLCKKCSKKVKEKLQEIIRNIKAYSRKV